MCQVGAHREVHGRADSGWSAILAVAARAGGRRLGPVRPRINFGAMAPLLIASLVSFCATLLLIRLSKRHAHLTNDHDLSGPQKFHAHPVPRVGGVGIVAGVVAAIAGVLLFRAELPATGLLIVVCGIPAFLAGIAEDLTKKVTPRWRLLCTGLSAALAGWLADVVITHTTIPGLDWIVTFGAGALLVTVFVVAGVANAVNIIDGFNGLASMCVLLMLLALAYVGASVGDRLVVFLAVAGAGALLGFFVWNFPAGLIFLGDGGAYFAGYYLAEVAILLLHRNPSVSPLFPLLLCIYPVFETVFSIYRKRFLRGMSPGVPDGVHLHMLVYKRLMRWAVGSRSARELTRRNSMTSPYLWLLCMLSLAPAVLWWDSTPMMALFIVLFAVLYIALYWRIVRFQSPRWLVFRRHRAVQRPVGR